MTQVTAKTLAQALSWMENNPHYKASAEEKHLVLSNYHDRCRIPFKILDSKRDTYRPGGKWDTRMYRPTFKGKCIILWAWIKEKLS